MDELLCVLMCHFNFLYREFSFKIVGSQYLPEEFGNAEIRMENDSVAITLTIDHGEFGVMLRPLRADGDWFTLGVVADVLNDRAMNLSYYNIAAMLLRIYPRMIEAFSPEKWESTRRKLLRRGGMPL